MQNDPIAKSTGFCGLIGRRVGWHLTGRGWLALILSLSFASIVPFFGIHSFLSLNQPFDDAVPIIEGWIPEDSLRVVAAEFSLSNRHLIYVVGCPVSAASRSDSRPYTYAELGASRLREAGVPRDQIRVVPCYERKRDRTYAAALALRGQLDLEGRTNKRLNVVTVGVHSRRSRLLFRKAFGDSAEIGVESITDSKYPPERWWRYSEGVKEVVSEAAAYIYVRLFFWPSDPVKG